MTNNPFSNFKKVALSLQPAKGREHALARFFWTFRHLIKWIFQDFHDFMTNNPFSSFKKVARTLQTAKSSEHTFDGFLVLFICESFLRVLVEMHSATTAFLKTVAFRMKQWEKNNFLFESWNWGLLLTTTFCGISIMHLYCNLCIIQSSHANHVYFPINVGDWTKEVKFGVEWLKQQRKWLHNHLWRTLTKYRYSMWNFFIASMIAIIFVKEVHHSVVH